MLLTLSDNSRRKGYVSDGLWRYGKFTRATHYSQGITEKGHTPLQGEKVCHLGSPKQRKSSGAYYEKGQLHKRVAAQVKMDTCLHGFTPWSAEG